MINSALDAPKRATDPAANRPATRIVFTTLVVFASSAIVYLSLLSVHYIGDGIRWFHLITESPTPPGGGVSHLGYPALQWGWNRLVQLLGTPSGVGTAIARLQALNALLAAAGLAMFYALLLTWRARSGAAALATLGLAGSYAFAVHATDMTEVMPSFPLAVAALLVAFARRGGSTGVAAPIGAALLLGLAAAIYLNAILLAPAVAVGLLDPAIWTHRSPPLTLLRSIARSSRLWAFGAVLLGCAAAIVAVARLSHDPVLADPTLNGAYGRVSAAHVIGLIFGLANSQWGLVGFSGGARILQGGLHEPQLFNLLVTAVAAAALVLAGAWVYKDWRSDPGIRSYLLAVALWLLIPLAFAAYWDNTYTKLWLAPVAGWWAVVALVISTRPIGWRWVAALILVGTVVGADLTEHIAPDHFNSDSALTEATALAARVRPADLVVSTGFETVGAEYQALMRKPYFSYIDAAYHHPGDQSGLTGSLDSQLCRVGRKGGTVYAVALLDISRDQWSAFLGDRLHLDYERLDGLRQRSTAVQLGSRTDPESVRIIQGTWMC